MSRIGRPRNRGTRNIVTNLRCLPIPLQICLLPPAREDSMASYKLVTYGGVDGPRAGLAIGDRVCDAAKLTGHAGDGSVLGILQDWTAARERLGNAAASPAAGQPLATTRL